MRRRTKIIAALLGLATLSAETCQSADPNDGVGDRPGHIPPPIAIDDTRPRCPDIEFRSADERCFTIQTFVESRVGPYDVYINITGGNGAYPPHVPVAAGGWKHAVVYRTGEKLVITITVEVERPGFSEDAYCSITDGSQVARDTFKSAKASGGAPYIAVATLTTGQ